MSAMSTMVMAAGVVLAAGVAMAGAGGPTITAEQARIRTVGQMTGEAWNIWSNGDIGDYVNVAQPGMYKVTVRAYGSVCGGVWPEMAVTVDGAAGKSQSVSTASPAEYSFTVALTPGIHCVTATFLNDARTDKEDRNLYVVSISIEPPADAAAPTLGDPKLWQADMAKREQVVVDEADRAIEKIRKGEVMVRVLDAAGKPVPGAQVQVEQVKQDFLFGCNIYMFDHFGSERENELYKERFAALFNYATTGFYWASYERTRGRPDYAYTDKVVAWCAEHGIRVKGHPLLWAHEAGVPGWSKGQPPEEVRKQRVTDIVSRYAGKIEFWEVVNEPSHNPGLTIDEPYRWARAADPKAKLIVNDYEAMANGFPPFYRLLEKAKADGVPFEGIGIQAHEPLTMRFPLDQVRQRLDQYAALGKELNITEFTPTSAGQPITGSYAKGQWDEAAQADYAARFYRVCFAHPAVVAITWWDLCDRGAWQKGGGLLREDLSPKPAYAALQKLIREEWRTRAAGKADQEGRFRFRGFFGAYKVSVDGRGAPGEYKVGRPAEEGAGPAQWTVQLGK